MVRTLMIDDMKAIWLRWRPILFPALLVFLISLVTFAINLPIVTGFAMLSAILASVVILGSLPIILIVHYYKNFYSNEGYLTFTLPVSGRELYWSKFITSFIFILIDSLILVPILFLFTVAADIQMRLPNFFTLKNIWQAWLSYEHKAISIVMLIVYFLFVSFCSIAQMNFVISKGMEARFHRIGLGGPVVMYVITYLVQQFASLAGMLLLPLGIRFDILADGSASNISFVMESSLEAFKDAITGGANQEYFTLGLGFALFLLILAIVYVFMTIRSLERHVSLR